MLNSSSCYLRSIVFCSLKPTCFCLSVCHHYNSCLYGSFVSLKYRYVGAALFQERYSSRDVDCLAESWYLHPSIKDFGNYITLLKLVHRSVWDLIHAFCRSLRHLLLFCSFSLFQIWPQSTSCTYDYFQRNQNQSFARRPLYFVAFEWYFINSSRCWFCLLYLRLGY